MLEKKTSLGKIHFPESVIERIIEDAISSCDGKVSLGNYKGKYMSYVPGSDFAIEETMGGLDITVYVIIRFGAGIRSCSRQIIEYINENVEKVMGERPRTVKIIVTGIQSRSIARRHIEIT